MILPYEIVDIPDMGGYNYVQGNVTYRYVYVGERKVDENGKTHHPPARSIGRLVDTPQGQKLIPNEFYYELMGIAEPTVAVKEGPGRKPYRKKPVAPALRADDAQIAVGYGLCVSIIAGQLKLDKALESAFGAERGRRVLALAAYLCECQHSSLDGLSDFVGTHLAGSDFDFKFDRREAGQLLVELTPERRGAFYRQWLELNRPGREVFYDVTSYSTYSGQIIQAHYGYNRDNEDLVQINQGLFCDRDSGLPLFQLSYDGSLNDKQNFNCALAAAHTAGMDADGKKKLTVVIDGGFSLNNFNWCHFQGYDLIAGVSCDRLKAVREAYINWSRSITESDRDKVWLLNDHSYISSQVKLSLGGLDGVLMMYRDLETEINKRAQLARQRQNMEQELKNTERAPERGFEEWANSFRPFFKVTRSRGCKGFTYELDEEAFAEANALCGKVTLFVVKSRGKITEQEALELYRSKEAVEDCFDTTKNGLCDKRLHLHGDTRSEGKLFMMFIALILRRAIHSRLKELLEKEDISTADAIRDLEQIKLHKEGDNFRLKDAISKRQREIITALKLELGPETPVVNQALFKPRVRHGRKQKNAPKPLDQALEAMT